MSAADHLPVVESDRDLDDWGRSARVSAVLDRTLWDQAYHRWFGVTLEQPRQIPSFGGGLLIVNGGAGSPVAALLAKAVRERHPRRRDARPCVAPAMLAQPGLAVLLRRAGAVAVHEDDLLRLLGDEGELVVLSVRTDRLGDDDVTAGLARHPAVVAAVRSGVPLVPVAARGAGDAARVLARLPLPGGRSLPIPLGLPAVGPIELSGYLPTAVQLRTLAPIAPDAALADGAWAGASPATGGSAESHVGPGRLRQAAGGGPERGAPASRTTAVHAEAERLALSVARRLRHEHADMVRAHRRRGSR